MFKNVNQSVVLFGKIKSAKPINNEDQPINVIISFQLDSQILWTKIFSNPAIIDKKDKIIRNFSSFRSANICRILFGLKLKIIKKLTQTSEKHIEWDY